MFPQSDTRQESVSLPTRANFNTKALHLKEACIRVERRLFCNVISDKQNFSIEQI